MWEAGGEKAVDESQWTLENDGKRRKLAEKIQSFSPIAMETVRTPPVDENHWAHSFHRDREFPVTQVGLPQLLGPRSLSWQVGMRSTGDCGTAVLCTLSLSHGLLPLSHQSFNPIPKLWKHSSSNIRLQADGLCPSIPSYRHHPLSLL